MSLIQGQFVEDQYPERIHPPQIAIVGQESLAPGCQRGSDLDSVGCAQVVSGAEISGTVGDSGVYVEQQQILIVAKNLKVRMFESDITGSFWMCQHLR